MCIKKKKKKKNNNNNNNALFITKELKMSMCQIYSWLLRRSIARESSNGFSRLSLIKVEACIFILFYFIFF